MQQFLLQGHKTSSYKRVDMWMNVQNEHSNHTVLFPSYCCRLFFFSDTIAAFVSHTNTKIHDIFLGRNRTYITHHFLYNRTELNTTRTTSIEQDWCDTVRGQPASQPAWCSSCEYRPGVEGRVNVAS